MNCVHLAGRCLLRDWVESFKLVCWKMLQKMRLESCRWIASALPNASTPFSSVCLHQKLCVVFLINFSFEFSICSAHPALLVRKSQFTVCLPIRPDCVRLENWKIAKFSILQLEKCKLHSAKVNGGPSAQFGKRAVRNSLEQFGAVWSSSKCFGAFHSSS